MKAESQFIFHKACNFVDIGRQYCFGGVCEIHTPPLVPFPPTQIHVHACEWMPT